VTVSKKDAMEIEEARNLAVELLLDVKDILSQINQIIVTNNLIPKNPTHTLDASCLLDEVVTEIQDEG